jgi:high-affinity Fe2+/Pb2+ permease
VERRRNGTLKNQELSFAEMSENPDATGKIIRFACGAIFGFLLGFNFVYFGFSMPPARFIVGILAAIIFGILAVRYGDRFWERLTNWLQWL